MICSQAIQYHTDPTPHAAIQYTQTHYSQCEWTTIMRSTLLLVMPIPIPEHPDRLNDRKSLASHDIWVFGPDPNVYGLIARANRLATQERWGAPQVSCGAHRTQSQCRCSLGSYHDTAPRQYPCKNQHRDHVRDGGGWDCHVRFHAQGCFRLNPTIPGVVFDSTDCDKELHPACSTLTRKASARPQLA